MSQTDEQGGFFTIWVLGLCVVLLFIGGLSLDLWNGFSQRRQLEEIADGATVAGGSQIDLPTFKSNGTVVLDVNAARRSAFQYIDQAKADDNITLTEEKVEVVDNHLRVELSRNVAMTLTKVLAPVTDPYVIKVSSAAEPVPS